eukprot:579637-Amphidinium_carterae.1
MSCSRQDRAGEQEFKGVDEWEIEALRQKATREPCIEMLHWEDRIVRKFFASVSFVVEALKKRC